MIERLAALLKMRSPVQGNNGFLFDSGTTVPTSGATGWQTSCVFQHTDGGAGTALYINEGDESSADFQPIAASALLSAIAGVSTASKALILDSSGHLASGSIIMDDMVAGTGISTGAGTICEHSVVKVGGLFKTEILIDLTGLNGCGAADDIIGKDGGTANCHIGQITAAKNGTIIAGRVTCFESPAGGNTDIDIYGSADEATGVQDTAISGLTGEEKLINHGAWTAEDVDYFDVSTLPDADGYLYLVAGTNTDADFTAGILLIEMWGK